MLAYLLGMVKRPLTIYQQLRADGTIAADAQQLSAVTLLDVLFNTLESPKKSLFGRFKKSKPAKGLYLWGSVGIGKTFLMDLFYDCLTIPKRRIHFFAFMLDVHRQLNQQQGQKDPLKLIADKVTQDINVLCFDEFFVTNIADAMILGELFKLLFDRGIVLVATSNVAPDDLYKNGLQRERFLPAIEALKTHTDVIHLANHHDYRQLHDKPAAVYFFPLDDYNEQAMQHAFEYYSDSTTSQPQSLTLNDHTFPVIAKHQGILWCLFTELC
ncbi:MAG: cell division protein ZapE, partial [Coxiella sp. (in: Bacteria)]